MFKLFEVAFLAINFRFGAAKVCFVLRALIAFFHCALTSLGAYLALIFIIANDRRCYARPVIGDVLFFLALGRAQFVDILMLLFIRVSLGAQLFDQPFGIGDTPLFEFLDAANLGFFCGNALLFQSLAGLVAIILPVDATAENNDGKRNAQRAWRQQSARRCVRFIMQRRIVCVAFLRRTQHIGSSL